MLAGVVMMYDKIMEANKVPAEPFDKWYHQVYWDESASERGFEPHILLTYEQWEVL